MYYLCLFKITGILMDLYLCRIPYIFDIIADYPSTSEAILDFHVSF